jgi:hypothetical protein
MSGFDDYEDEMANNRFSDSDIEQLLSGRATANVELSALAPVLQKLREQSIRGVSEDEVAAFAVIAAEAARSAIPVVSKPGREAAPARRLRFLRPRLATALTLVFLLSGMTGLAFAADGAAPGDALYGLDRALERIGIGNGAAAERIAEAQALFQEGLVSEAMAHTAGAIEESDDGILGEDASDAAEALLGAADAVTSTDQGEADAVRASVAEMLSWMAANASSEDPLTGSEFSEMVAGFAKGISGRASGEENGADQPEGTNGQPEGVPGGRPDNVPPGPPAGFPPRP